MAIINQSNILNLQPGITAPVVVHMSEGDSGTNLSFKLIDGARAWTDPGNVVAAVHGRRQDGAQFGPYACAISGDVVSFQTDAAIAAVAGSGIAQIVLTDSDQNTAGTANFAIMVERATFPMGVTYTNDVSVYEAILAYVQTIPAAVTEDYTAKIEAEEAARVAADDSINSSIGALGDRVTSEVATLGQADAVLSARMDEFTKLPDGSLSTAADAELVDIRVKANGKTAATAGDAVREQVTKLKNDLTAIYTGVYTVQDYTLGGTNRNGDFIATNNKCRPTDMISVYKGDVITIKNGNMARHARLAWTIDEQGNLTNIYDGPWTYTDETVTAEVDCMYLVIFSFDPLSTIDLSTFTGSINIDRAQSFSGFAEEIESIKTKQGEYIDVSNLGWELGTFNDTTGLDQESTSRIRTKEIFLFPKGTVVSSNAQNVVLHFWYPSGFNNPQGQMWSQTVTLPQDYYVRIVMKKMDNTAITDIPEVYKDLTIYVPNGGVVSKAPIANTENLMVTSGVNPLFYSTQLMAHRGTSTAPENTMSAYKQAYANGLRMMETDIKFSSDNIPVLLHDDTIDRTSNGSGTCSSIPLETLKTYDFGSWFSPSFAGEKIPTLAEFLVFCKTHNCVAELDLAESNYDEPHLATIYRVVKQCGMLKNTVFTVYNSAATILKGIDKNIILCIGGITSQSLAYNAISQNNDCALLILSLPIANFSEQLALYIANLGCKVRAWVVNDAATAVTTFESCCDYILTDSLKASDIVFD